MSQQSRTKTGILLALAVIAVSRLVSGSFFQLSIAEFLLLVAIPTVYLKLAGRRLKDYGFTGGDVLQGLKYTVVIFMLATPFMLVGSTIESFRAYYPLWKPAYANINNFILYELAVGVMLFSTEFFYRGFLLFTLNKETKYGNLIQAFIYALAHIGKPFLEVPYSFFAGLVFGSVDARCKSILPSFLMHFLGNVAFDLMILYFTGFS